MSLLSKSNLCKRILGIAPEIVMNIADDYETVILNIIGNKLKWSKYKGVIFFLFYLKQYVVDSVLGLIFNISTTTACRLRTEFVKEFSNIARKYLKIPTKEERLQRAKQFRNQTIVMVIDGFEQQSVKFVNKDQEEKFHSGKKKKSTITKLVGCDPGTGKIMWWTNSYPGSHSDAQLLGLEKEKLPEFGEHECIMADAGFNNLNNLFGSRHIVPFRCSPGMGLTHNEDVLNNKIAEIRIIIENYICQIKKMRCLSDRFRFKNDAEELLKTHDDHCMVVFFILDKYKLPRGIRSN